MPLLSFYISPSSYHIARRQFPLKHTFPTLFLAVDDSDTLLSHIGNRCSATVLRHSGPIGGLES